jgi:hypothetical protein
VWKIGAHWQLTSLASTSCSCLHNSSAIDFFIGAIFLRDEDCAQCKALKISLLQVEEENNRGVAMLSVRILQFETI